MAKKPAQIMKEASEDDEDFITPKPSSVKPEKPKPAPSPQAPVEDPDPEPEKPRFHPRLREAAEEWGLSEEDIESCETQQDLKDLIKTQSDLAHERRAKQMGTSGGGREGTQGPGNAAPPEVPATQKATSEPATEESLAELFDELKGEVTESKGYDKGLVGVLKRFGKELDTLRTNTSQAKLERLEKEMEEAKQTIHRMRASNSPMTKRVNSTIAKYASLFGDDFDDDGMPPEGTDERDRYDMMVAKIGRMNAAKKATGVPEKDIPAAIASLWPGTKAGAVVEPDEADASPPPAKQAAPASVPKKKPDTTRIEEWNESGQAPAVNRNGSARSGVPSDKEAVAHIAKKLKERGQDPGTTSDEDDEDDF